ncbi:TetR/AcrR family transcriptional regulator [Agreia sp. COWG]|uniref:TetR/AcrR family transcriptional regulator n=1 Tax=Agreia sp. COWG TaxID=2773266 RepID=UPI001927CBA1|nr:TetR/AcrR family transcriptional regulator [Agreia sp. COWG]CAD5990385.1 Transcriptional regulator, TetR family [Agreia sp. COWG]
MPKVTEQYREAKREEIADAALRCFAKKGFGASMADIIAESGLSAGAIYGHFSSKAEVMSAVARSVMGTRIEDMQTLRTRERTPSPAEVVTRILSALEVDLAGTGLLLQVWGESVTDPSIHAIVDGVFGELRKSYEQIFAEWVIAERGLGETEAKHWASSLAAVAIGLGQGYIAQSALFPDFDGIAYLATASELLPH